MSRHILRAVAARSGKGKIKVDTIEVRLVLRCLIAHGPTRYVPYAV